MITWNVRLTGKILLFLVMVRPAVGQDNLIAYPHRVGGITARTTEEELVTLYGKKNLARAIRPWGDSGYGCATVLYGGTERELSIFWREDQLGYDASGSPEQQRECAARPSRQKPAGVVLSINLEVAPPLKPKGWKTAEGVYVGMSLTELERLNRAPIEFESSASCFDGGITSWSGGRLEKLKELLAYSRLVYPLDEVEPMKKGAVVNSRDLASSLKEKILLGNVEFSFPHSGGD